MYNEMCIKKELNYNYVFFFAIYDYMIPILGKELYIHPQVRIYKYAFHGNSFQQKLYHLHTSYSINQRINLSFKKIWFRRMYNQNFDNDLPICFIFLGGNMLRFDSGFTDYVRKRDPRNKIVMLHWDLISKKIKYDYSIIKNKVDLAVTYDKREAEKYHIHYFKDTPYSKILNVPEQVEIKQDVYFLGAAKDRLDKLYDVFYYLRFDFF